MTRILLDEGVPRPLARRLRLLGLDVEPFPNEWKQLTNGKLLSAVVQSGFEVLITNDKNMQFQQKLGLRDLAVLVLPTNRLTLLIPIVTEIAAAIPGLQVGQFTSLRATIETPAK